jgi:hypothetical protein
MSAGNFHGLVNGSAEPNGTSHPTAESRGSTGSRGRRSAKRLAHAANELPKIEPPPELAGFINTESQPQDAPMWPIHPVLWLQPQLQLGVPATGLHIERKHTVPIPDALRLSVTPVNRPALLEKNFSPVPPHIDRRLPASGLGPLGWDPRVVSHSSAKEDQI